MAGNTVLIFLITIIQQSTILQVVAMMFDYGHGWGFGGMWIFSALIWILVIVGIVYLVRGLLTQNNSANKSDKDDSPLVILKRRYANGEIDKDTYERIKKDLEE